MFEAMEDGKLTACSIIGENPMRSEADTGRARKLLAGLEHLVVQSTLLVTDPQPRRECARPLA
jgi:predicted molibdopterin-dependent oxidoreductase YjgC